MAVKIPSQLLSHKEALIQKMKTDLQGLADSLVDERSKWNDQQEEEFKREVGFLYSLRHPSICMCFGGCSVPLPICILEFVPKGDLRSFYSSRELTIEQHVTIGYSISTGLAWLHAREPVILHCGKFSIFPFSIDGHHSFIHSFIFFL